MQVLRDSSEVIEEYLTVMRREINPSKEYERLTRSVLSKIDVSTATQTDIINSESQKQLILCING